MLEQHARSLVLYRLIDLLHVWLRSSGQAPANVHGTADLFRKSVIDPHEEAFRVAPGGTEEQTLEEFFRSDKNLETYIRSSAAQELRL